MRYWSLVMSHMTNNFISWILWKYLSKTAEFLKKNFYVLILSLRRIAVSFASVLPKYICQNHHFWTKTWQIIHQKSAKRCKKAPWNPLVWRFIILYIILVFYENDVLTSRSFCGHSDMQAMRLAHLFGGRFEKQQLLVFFSSEVTYD